MIDPLKTDHPIIVAEGQPLHFTFFDRLRILVGQPVSIRVGVQLNPARTELTALDVLYCVSPPTATDQPAPPTTPQP